jgi:hypothetical protein
VNSSGANGARPRRLHGKVAERRGCRERVRCRNHVYRGVSMEGTDSVALGIPAGTEGGSGYSDPSGFIG